MDSFVFYAILLALLLYIALAVTCLLLLYILRRGVMRYIVLIILFLSQGLKVRFHAIAPTTHFFVEYVRVEVNKIKAYRFKKK